MLPPRALPSAGGLSPKSIQNYFQVVKMVFSSCVNEDGEEICPRNWKKMGLVIPKVIKKKQRRQVFCSAPATVSI
jgi:hypothetical protein